MGRIVKPGFTPRVNLLVSLHDGHAEAEEMVPLRL